MNAMEPNQTRDALLYETLCLSIGNYCCEKDALTWVHRQGCNEKMDGFSEEYNDDRVIEM